MPLELQVQVDEPSTSKYYSRPDQMERRLLRLRCIDILPKLIQRVLENY